MNDIRRTILWVIFGFSMVLLWDKWQLHNGNKATFFPTTTPAVTGRPADLALAALRADLEDSDLPWRVDVCVLDDLPAPLQELIAVQGVVLPGPDAQNNS